MSAAASPERATIEALAAPTRHLFLSPHYDDIALSCGGAARLLAQAARSPEVALIFGAAPDPDEPLTRFADYQHRSWGLNAAEAITARRAEEAAAAAILGTSVAVLPFRDAIYRGDHYTDDDRLFGELAPYETELAGEIVAALDLPAASNGSTRLYAPLGLGNHVDHQHAYAVGVRLAKIGWDVWFYEDLPYALRPGMLDARRARMAERLELAASVEVGEVWDAKIDAILCYPSQLKMIFGDLAAGATRPEIDAVMRQYALAAGSGVPAERFWRLARNESRPRAVLREGFGR